MEDLRRRCAIMTVVYDGGELFNLWRRYYDQYFEEQDVYILCNLEDMKKSNLLNGGGYNLVSYSRPVYARATGPQRVYGVTEVNDIKNRLLLKYKCVVYTDIDEIIFHPDGLNTVIDNLSSDFATCTGYEIVQNRSEEKSFDFSKTVAEQRNYWYRFSAYDKPLILRKGKLNWVVGRHALGGPDLHRWLDPTLESPNKIKDLYLLHLHKLDEELAIKMHDTHGVIINHEAWWREAESKLELIPSELRKQFTF